MGVEELHEYQLMLLQYQKLIKQQYDLVEKLKCDNNCIGRSDLYSKLETTLLGDKLPFEDNNVPISYAGRSISRDSESNSFSPVLPLSLQSTDDDKFLDISAF